MQDSSKCLPTSPPTLPRKPLPLVTGHDSQAELGASSLRWAPDGTQDLFEQKRELRRLRRNLRDSGDWLGPQGLNPNTGLWDSGLSGNETNPMTHQDRRSKQDKSSQDEAHKIAKENAAKTAHQKLQGRKRIDQWSSAASPNLSPITQSQSSLSPEHGLYSSVSMWITSEID